MSVEIRLRDGESLDEVVANGEQVHLERMSPIKWFLGVGGVQVWLGSSSKITAYFEDSENSAKDIPKVSLAELRDTLSGGEDIINNPYPPDETIDAWYDEWEKFVSVHADKDIPSLEKFIAVKACDWQRERDGAEPVPDFNRSAKLTPEDIKDIVDKANE
jgi:hypothetical protein